MMNCRTRTLLPTSKQQIIGKTIAVKVIYDRKAGPVYTKSAIGTYAYAKPPPQKRGNPWIHGQMTDSDDQSYTLKIPNNTTIRGNRVHITPAAIPSKPLIIRTPVLVHPQTMLNKNKYISLKRN